MAGREARRMGALKNSITKGEGNLCGVLGEYVARAHMQAEFDHDLEHDLVREGLRYEVKTKRCTSAPKDHYLCSVSDANHSQSSDFYVFVRVLKDLKRAWILGEISVSEFFARATFHEKGDVDPESQHGWLFKADCYNLPIRRLYPCAGAVEVAEQIFL